MPSLHARRLCALALLILSLNGVGSAQSRGSITGRVVDQQNAVIPGAALDPGTYSVAVEQAGFKTMIRDGIALETGDRLAIDLKLEVGQTNQSVEVTAETPVVDTTSAGGGAYGRPRDCAVALHHDEPVLPAGAHTWHDLSGCTGHCASLR